MLSPWIKRQNLPFDCGCAHSTRQRNLSRVPRRCPAQALQIRLDLVGPAPAVGASGLHALVDHAPAMLRLLTPGVLLAFVADHKEQVAAMLTAVHPGPPSRNERVMLQTVLVQENHVLSDDVFPVHRCLAFQRLRCRVERATCPGPYAQRSRT